ncbi:MAG: Clp protease ClpP [Clostridiales bacterium]|nr:Clp protease ClpP [Clostridiales bacterium]
MKQDYFKITNITDTKAEIQIYGDIVSDEGEKWSNADVCPKDVINALEKVKGKDLDIYINSCGGSVFGGIAIYNIIKRHNGRKTVTIDSIAGSIASVIAMAGDEINMYKNSFMVIHKPLSISYGNANDLRKTADELDKIESVIIDVYNSKLINKEDISKITEMVDKETWLTAAEVSDYFNINLLEENKAVASIKTDMKFKNIPVDLKNIFEKETELTELTQLTELTKTTNKENDKIKKLALELELITL